MKTMNFKDDIPPILVDDFKGHYVLVFDITAKTGTAEHYHYHEIFGEPLSLELYFSSALEYITAVIELGRLMSFVAVDMFDVLGKNL